MEEQNSLQLTQECINCYKIKPLNDFYLDPQDNDKRRGVCIECWKKRNSQYYLNHRDEIINRTSKWVKEHPERMKIIYAEKRWRDGNVLFQGEPLTYNIAEKIMKHKNYCCWLCELLVNDSGCIDHSHKTGEVRGYFCFSI